jgi:TPP-dependent pyruvate/acetoin dehydrogenase alpha subunit
MTLLDRTSGGGASSTGLLPMDLTGVDRDQAADWLARMSLIRQFETVAEPLVSAGKIPGGMHSAIGQEATAVGVLSALAETDVVTGTHRSHHITLAKGLPPAEVMAELYGKATGLLGGRGGHMHLADVGRGHYGSNGIVGAGLGIALGAALASSVARRGQVAVGFVGDGAANIGRVWEFVNLAVIWRLPLLIVCENNLYAVETPYQQVTGGGDIAARAAGFGLPTAKVDGQDVAEVHRVAAVAVARARAGDGPTFVESLTYRLGGHDVGDRETYRTREEVERWRAAQDPVLRLAAAAQVAGLLSADDVAAATAAAERAVAAAVEFAESSPFPDPATLTDGVTATDLRIRSNP